MQFRKRLEKVETKISSKNSTTIFLLVLSDQDEIDQIAKHKAENPGMPYNVIRIELVKPAIKEINPCGLPG